MGGMRAQKAREQGRLVGTQIRAGLHRPLAAVWDEDEDDTEHFLGRIWICSSLYLFVRHEENAATAGISWGQKPARALPPPRGAGCHLFYLSMSLEGLYHLTPCCWKLATYSWDLGHSAWSVPLTGQFTLKIYI